MHDPLFKTVHFAMANAFEVPKEKDRPEWEGNQRYHIQSPVYKEVQKKVGASVQSNSSKTELIRVPTEQTRTFRQHYLIDFVFQYGLMHYLSEAVTDPTETIHFGKLAAKILASGYGHNREEQLHQQEYKLKQLAEGLYDEVKSRFFVLLPDFQLGNWALPLNDFKPTCFVRAGASRQAVKNISEWDNKPKSTFYKTQMLDEAKAKSLSQHIDNAKNSKPGASDEPMH